LLYTTESQGNFTGEKDMKPKNIAAGFGIGIAMGMGVGIAMDNIAIGMAIGIMFALIFSAAARRKDGDKS
jgi:hypothetical protein